MPYANRVWYISELLEEMSKELKLETLSIHKNTVDNWFKRMEKEEIHFVHREDSKFRKEPKYRIYDDTDLKIACYLYIETKINEESIGTIFKYKFTNIKTRSYDEAKLDIFETNKEAADFSKAFGVKPILREKPPVLERKKDINSKSGDTLELREVLKKEITFNGQRLTSNDKQRIVDFLSGLICPINYL